jgi:hypothetical protein
MHSYGDAGSCSGRPPCHPARSRRRTAWWCRGACRRVSWFRTYPVSTAVLAECGRVPGSAISRRWTRPPHGRADPCRCRDILDLGGKGRIGGATEGTDAVRLEPVHFPDALDHAQAQADGLGHRPPGPVCRRSRRLRAGQGDHPVPRCKRLPWDPPHCSRT